MTDETFIPIANLDEWSTWLDANRDALDVSETDAFLLACNQCLMVGGGAAPLFRVGFVD